MDGPAAHIANSFDLDLYDGAIWLFRSRRVDRVKVIVWDGCGLILAMKRLRDSRFVFPIGSTLSAQCRQSALHPSTTESVLAGWSTHLHRKDPVRSAWQRVAVHSEIVPGANFFQQSDAGWLPIEHLLRDGAGRRAI
ncbi:MAG: hypothetical protein CFE33_19540 [Pseudorhodobacter sp. PARRP1]|nr:MAG: hypothetical protein CFE33_19540 [Pseudorhodobacter sp. PARRP1]